MTELTRRDDPAAIRAIGHVSTLCGVVAAFMIFASVLITCQMIFLRAVMGQSTVWQTEAVIYLMIGATLIGLPYVQKLRGHVGVDLVPGMLPAGARKMLAVGVLLATIFMIALMLGYGWEMFHLAWERNWRSESVWGIKLWIPYLAVPLGFALFALQLVADLWAVATGHDDVNPDVAPEDRRH
ncbi:TRAP transporter small permease [uncultured Limimaricola sp.]|uniref:TRAP transporter small permease subunit n=1 Tax=uncultured Limimaricola sp. TaxID=2211667 RepID=UPI0030F68F26